MNIDDPIVWEEPLRVEWHGMKATVVQPYMDVFDAWIDGQSRRVFGELVDAVAWVETAMRLALARRIIAEQAKEIEKLKGTT